MESTRVLQPVHKLIRQFERDVITFDELLTESRSWAMDLMQTFEGPDLLLQLGPLVEPLPPSSGLLLQVQAIQAFMRWAARTAATPSHFEEVGSMPDRPSPWSRSRIGLTPESMRVHLLKLSERLVIEWLRLVTESLMWPDDVGYLLDLPNDTPNASALVERLALTSAGAHPELLARFRAHVAPDPIVAARVLIEAVEPCANPSLAIEALHYLDNLTPDDPVVRDLAGKALSVGRRSAGAGDCYGDWLPEACGWAAVYADSALVLQLAQDFAQVSISPYYGGGCRSGLVAFATWFAGGDPGDAAARSTYQMGWATAGDRAVGTWVLAAAQPDAGLRLAQLRATGIDLTFDTDVFTTRDGLLREFWPIIRYGMLKHGKLPRLHARAWYDAALACRELGLPTDVADAGARYWFAAQDTAGEGHLWRAGELHRFTDLIRVSPVEIAVLAQP